MSLFSNLLILLITLTWVSGVSADNPSRWHSPESVVTCQTQGPMDYAVIALSVATAINTEQCAETPDGFADSCAPCISSLENQGCKVVDVVTGKSNEIPNVTYLLSCIRP